MRYAASLSAPLTFATALALFASAASAEVIWRGDFEAGDTKQWRSTPQAAGISVVTEPVRAGKYALRIDGTNAARRGKLDRIEFQHQPNPPGTAEGSERYFGWSVMAPKQLTDDFHSVGYFETRNSWRQLMSFEVKGADILYSTRVPYAKRWSGAGKFTAGRWHDFVVHVLWSRDPAKGFVEVWYDGELVVPRTPTATLLDDNPAFLQVGFMRNTSDTPESILIDHVIEATTLAEAQPPKQPAADAPKPDATQPPAVKPAAVKPSAANQSLVVSRPAPGDLAGMKIVMSSRQAGKFVATNRTGEVVLIDPSSRAVSRRLRVPDLTSTRPAPSNSIRPPTPCCIATRTNSWSRSISAPRSSKRVR